MIRGGWFVGVFLGVLAGLGTLNFFPNLTYAQYELTSNVYLSGCPFVHEDQYDFTPLLNTIKAQLEVKIEGNARCNQQINSLYANLSTISDYYGTLDPSLRQHIANDVLKNYLSELNVQKAQLELNNQTDGFEYQNVLTAISTLEPQIANNEIDLLYNHQNFKQNQELQFRTGLLNHVNNLVVNLAAISSQNPRCMDQMGGWTQILPAVLSSASLASGLGAFPGHEVVGLSTQLAANLIVLFQDYGAKKALNEIVQTQNAQILACTYFAVKSAACAYKLGYELSQDIPKIKELIFNRYSGGPIGEYEKYFQFSSKMSLYGNIFNAVGSMGSSLTLDIGNITKYVIAKVADPENLPPAPTGPEATDAAKKAWLIGVKLRGINVPDSQLNGAPVPIDDQVKSAQADIAQKKADILAIEAQLAATRSFVDLRNHLESNFPGIRKDVQDLLNFLNAYATGKEAPISPLRRGPLFSVVQILTKLQDFLSVPIETSGSYESYDVEVTKRGTDLFSAMAKGAIGQINKQSLLGLGSKMQERMSGAFLSLRNYFVERDLLKGERKELSFTQYLKDRALIHDVVQNYGKYQGTGVTFRSIGFSTSLDAIETGFRNEIKASLQKAVFEKTSIVPKLVGKTADHLCGLYASSLEVMGSSFWDYKSRKLSRKCRKYHQSIDLYGFMDQKKFQINYEDPCSYVKYVKTVQLQDILTNAMKQNGLSKRALSSHNSVNDILMLGRAKSSGQF